MNNVSRSKRLYKKIGNTLSYLNSIPQKFVDIREEPTKEIEFSTMLCTLTGALNRIGLRKYFDQMLPSDLNNMSLILIEIDYIDDYFRQAPNNLPDEILQKSFSEIIGLCGSEDLIVRWNLKEFVLVCPKISLENVNSLATKISRAINNKAWIKREQISCRSGVAQANGEDLHDLITHIKKKLHKSKEKA